MTCRRTAALCHPWGHALGLFRVHRQDHAARPAGARNSAQIAAFLPGASLRLTEDEVVKLDTPSA